MIVCFHMQVNIPVPSILKRFSHSTTAFSLGQASEVILFGGKDELLGGSLLAHTAVLRFGESTLKCMCVTRPKAPLPEMYNSHRYMKCSFLS